MSKLCKLTVQIFVNGVESLLELFLGELADWVVCGIMINVRQKNGLGEWGLDMLSRATIPVPTSTDLNAFSAYEW
jgi:hypothetical protein